MAAGVVESKGKPEKKSLAKAEDVMINIKKIEVPKAPVKVESKVEEKEEVFE